MLDILGYLILAVLASVGWVEEMEASNDLWSSATMGSLEAEARKGTGFRRRRLERVQWILQIDSKSPTWRKQRGEELELRSAVSGLSLLASRLHSEGIGNLMIAMARRSVLDEYWFPNRYLEVSSSDLVDQKW